MPLWVNNWMSVNKLYGVPFRASEYAVLTKFVQRGVCVGGWWGGEVGVSVWENGLKLLEECIPFS